MPSRLTGPERLVHAYAILLAASVFVLICSGGLVTSKGVGLSVPDWPTTYGYNMFAFPISRWVGGIFYEHTHRLIASGVGMLTVVLAIVLWRVDRRSWMRWLGLVAVFAVALQGLLGGLRVVELKDQIGIFHACLAQSFLLLTAFIALATSQWWRASGSITAAAAEPLRRVFVLITALIFTQLALGATMRHAHAGLSIRDFPTAYGRVWPRTDAAALAQVNHERTASLALPPTTATQIVLQMFHRFGALLIASAVLWAAWMALRARGELPRGVRRLALVGPILIALQITAGIYTIWTNKAADVATTHVALGALSFVWAGLMVAALGRQTAGSARIEAPAAVAREAQLVEAAP